VLSQSMQCVRALPAIFRDLSAFEGGSPRDRAESYGLSNAKMLWQTSAPDFDLGVL